MYIGNKKYPEHFPVGYLYEVDVELSNYLHFLTWKLHLHLNALVYLSKEAMIHIHVASSRAFHDR